MRLPAKNAQDLALRGNTRNEGSFTLFCIIVIFLVRNLHLQEESCLCALYHTSNGNNNFFLMFPLCISLSGFPSEYWNVSLLSWQDKWQVLTRKKVRFLTLHASICYRKCHLNTWGEINKNPGTLYRAQLSAMRNWWKILCLHFGKSLSFGRIFGIDKAGPLEFPGTSAAFKGMGSLLCPR